MGYLNRMVRQSGSGPVAALLGALFCMTAACNNFTMPQFTFPQPQQPVIPASVTVLFDESVRTATLRQTVCADTPWEGHLGDAITKAFQNTGRTRFTQMTIGPGTGTPQAAASPTAIPITAAITLGKNSFTTRTRSGSDDQFVAQLDVQLGVTFNDANGRLLGEAPLLYSEQVKIWTPLYGGTSQCRTQQLTDALHMASEQLASQFARYVGELTAKIQGQTGATRQAVASPPPTEPPVMTPTPAAAAPAPPAPAAQPPATMTQDADRYAVVVGVSLYRTPWAGWREGLAFDSKGTLSLLNHSLQVHENHTLLLQDELASQEDIEEALTTWLPKRVNKDSIVFFYFSGQALADSKTGEIYLIPYDGTPASSRTRLISLRWLQSRVQKLGAKLALAVLDTPLTGAAQSKDGKAKSVTPNWAADLAGSSGPSPATVIQIARSTSAALQPHGLLSGLAGDADLDHDGVVTLGEWLRSLRGSAVTVPALPPTVGVQSIPLTRVDAR